MVMLQAAKLLDNGAPSQREDSIIVSSARVAQMVSSQYVIGTDQADNREA